MEYCVLSRKVMNIENAETIPGVKSRGRRRINEWSSNEMIHVPEKVSTGRVYGTL